MNQDYFVPNDQRPSVMLVADPSGLSLSVVEQLISSFCKVQIVSSKTDKWKDSLSHIGSWSYITFVLPEERKLIRKFDHAIFISKIFTGELGGSDETELLSDLASTLPTNNAEALFIVPGVIFSEEQKRNVLSYRAVAEKHKDRVGVILLAELMGARPVFVKGSFLLNALEQLVSEKTVFIPRSGFKTVSAPQAAKEIVRKAFSFGGISEETFVYAHDLDKGRARDIFLNVGVKDVEFTDEGAAINLKSENEQKLTASPLKDIEDAVIWFRNRSKEAPKEPKQEAPIIEKQKTKEKLKKDSVITRIRKRVVKPKAFVFKRTHAVAVSLVILLLTAPFLLVVFSGASVYIAAKNVTAANPRVLNTTINSSVVISTATKNILENYLRTPLVGGLYEKSFTFSETLRKTSKVLDSAAKARNEVAVLAKGFLDSGDVDVYKTKETLVLELGSMYENISFIQSEISQQEGLLPALFEKALEEWGGYRVKEILLAGERMSKELLWLLGAEGVERTYLVLFQNNMELRPTGGFIGSFAIAKVKDGRLVDMNVQDVYSADGQLKGYVEPPGPIREHLGEAAWYLRDSNWDPDFPVSAERAEWFLDKELGIAVDGVIAIDLEVAKRAMSVFGEVAIEDFGRNITADNLYEITQYEAEGEFFPGSRRKATFLTALARELLLIAGSSDEKKAMELARNAWGLLERKHIQVFLHNRTAQKQIANLAWDGAVYQPVCSNNCYADYFGVVEANLGVNKANYFVQRSSAASVSLSENQVQRILRHTITNNAPVSTGNNGKYEVYLRLITPLEARFSDVLIDGAGETKRVAVEETIINGRKEGGVFVEVFPGQTIDITFSWQNTAGVVFGEPGEYRLVWRKQAGTQEDPITVQIEHPLSAPDSTTALTEGEPAIYNTNLSRDFSSRIFW